MKGQKLGGVAVVLAVLAGFGLLFWQSLKRERRRAEREERQQARSVCQRWADRLDAQTTDTGIYVRWKGEELPEADPWGRKLRVHYSQDGVAESLAVRSLGPDGEPNTADDVVVLRMAANLKGVGTGVKQNAEEVSSNAARGAVRGTAEGVRDEVRALFGGKKGKN